MADTLIMQESEDTFHYYEFNNQIHIVNDRHDIYSHDFSKNCWCKPSMIVTEEDQELWTHNPVQ